LSDYLIAILDALEQAKHASNSLRWTDTDATRYRALGSPPRRSRRGEREGQGIAR
jgi:hypothetical protein